MDIAVITGASSGLGKVFAEKVCVRYLDLDEVWLIARRKDRLEQFAQEHPTVKIRPIALDLSLDSSYEELAAILAEAKPNIRVFKLPFLDLDKVTDTALTRAASGKGNFTPMLFFKGYRVLCKIVPSALMAKIASVE